MWFLDDKDLDVAMDSPGSGNEDGKIGSIDNEDGDARLSGIRTVKHEKEVSYLFYLWFIYLFQNFLLYIFLIRYLQSLIQM